MAEITNQEILRRLINLESQVQKLSGSIEKVSKVGTKGMPVGSSAGTVDTPVVTTGSDHLDMDVFNATLDTLATQINKGFAVVDNIIKTMKSGGAG